MIPRPRFIYGYIYWSAKFIDLAVCSKLQCATHYMPCRCMAIDHKPAIQLFSDLQRCGYKVEYTTLEVGALGHVHPESLQQLR